MQKTLKNILLTSLMLCTVAAPGCAAAPKSAQAPAQKAASAEQIAYRLTAELLQEQKTGKNLVFSPYSLQQALNLISANTTDKKALKELAPYVDQTLTTEKLLHTKTGGLILLDKKLAPSYTGKNQGDVKLVDYPGEALQEKLAFQKRILDSVIDKEPLKGNLNFLTAAHYFAEWETKFDKTQTKPRPFTTETGKVRQVPTMKKTFTAGQAKITPDYEMACLNAKQGAKVYFIKPLKAGRTLAPQLDKLVASFEQRQGTVRNINLEVPKIALKEKSDLLTLLRTLKLNTLFDGTLTFSKLTGKLPYQIASATQTATLDVNEDYAEGKALTEIGFRVTSVMEPQKIYYVKMDSPYFIIIKDRTQDGTQRVVFTAWVAEP